MGAAFDEVAARIESAARKFYLLSYCSPSRAGTHRLSVKVKGQGESGELSHEFTAAGFGPGCDPKQAPKFRAGKVLLTGKKRR